MLPRDVVDYKAVAEGLRSKHLPELLLMYFRGTASNGEPFENELQEFDNVILTPILEAIPWKHRLISGLRLLKSL